jgi:hypothetical protein
VSLRPVKITRYNYAGQVEEYRADKRQHRHTRG